MRKAQNAKPDSRRAVMKQLGDIPMPLRKEILCELVGHSNLIQVHWDYMDSWTTCARCGQPHRPATLEQRLDIGSPKTRENRAKFQAMTWKDKLYAPSNPFSKESA